MSQKLWLHDLYRHQEWADAEHWRLLGAFDPARNDESHVLGVAIGRRPRAPEPRREAGRARLGPVPRAPHPLHRERARARRRDLPDADEPDLGIRRVASIHERGARGGRRSHLRVRTARTGHEPGREARPRTRYHGASVGGGVIGNTTGSGPVVGGSSPPPRARNNRPRPRRLVA